MAKRLIIPTLQSFSVSGGTGSVTIPQPSSTQPGRVLTYISITGGSTPQKKGKIYITDSDNAVIIWRDPKPGDPDVPIDFYTFELRIPLNGTYTLTIEDADEDGTYTLYSVIEERPRRV